MRTRVQWRSPVDSDFSDGRRRPGGDGRRHAFGVSAAELVTDRPELALLEFTDRDPAPSLGDAGRRTAKGAVSAVSAACRSLPLAPRVAF